MVPVILVAGFLGSGKTTFVRELAREAFARSLRGAFVINEFGALDVDGALLRAAEIEALTALAGGCACCSGQEDFVEAIWTLAQGQSAARGEAGASGVAPDFIVVEASGLADAVLLLESLTDPRIVRLVETHLICVLADATRPQWDDAMVADLVDRQFAVADVILLNKAGGLEAQELHEVEQDLRQRAAQAQILAANFGVPLRTSVWQAILDPALNPSGEQPASPRPLSRPVSAAGDGQGTAQQARGHVYAHSVLCPVPHPVERAALEEALRALPSQVWRAKGFVRLKGTSGIVLVQYSGGPAQSLVLAPFHMPVDMEEPPLELVFLGGQLDRQALRQAFGPGALGAWY